MRRILISITAASAAFMQMPNVALAAVTVLSSTYTENPFNFTWILEIGLSGTTVFNTPVLPQGLGVPSASAALWEPRVILTTNRGFVFDARHTSNADLLDISPAPRIHVYGDFFANLRRTTSGQALFDVSVPHQTFALPGQPAIPHLDFYTLSYDYPATEPVITFTLKGLHIVPEPATWLSLLTGFGLLGAALRRRRSKVRVRWLMG